MCWVAKIVVFVGFRGSTLRKFKGRVQKNNFLGLGTGCTLLDVCVSSLRRGHAHLLCIVPTSTDDPRRESDRDTLCGPGLRRPDAPDNACVVRVRDMRQADMYIHLAHVSGERLGCAQTVFNTPLG